jgi:hypothetical protein
MSRDINLDSTAALELTLLRSLCASRHLNAARARITPGLDDYQWHDEDHRIVYEALGKLSDRDKRPLREQLPVIATRMGFPDVDWENYFVTDATITEEEVRKLARKLAMSAGPRK